jgi:Fe-S cluster biogenesis protein NfuA
MHEIRKSGSTVHFLTNDAIKGNLEGRGSRKMLRNKVQEALNKVRPSLQADGGDVQLIDVDEKGVVKVKLTGACGGCPMSQMTLKMGIEKVLKQNVPEVTRVESV